MWVWEVGSLAILAVNQAAILHYGYTRAEFESMTLRDLRSEEDLPKLLKDLERLEDGVPKLARHRRKDGTLLDVEVIGTPVVFRGKTARLAQIADVTERRRVEAALRESESRYRQLVERGLGLICTHDLLGVVLSVNRAAAEALGYPPEEIVGRSLGDFFPRRYQAEFARYLAQYRTTGSSTGLLSILTKEGTERVWSYRNVVVMEEGPPYVLGHAQDITDQRRAEAELAHRAKVSAFAADVSRAMTHGETLAQGLQACAEAMVTHLGGAAAGIWTVHSGGDDLEQLATAGVKKAFSTIRSRVAIGKYRIGLVAERRQPALEDISASTSPLDWARQMGLVSFAGYPLLVKDRLVGVLALYSEEKLTEKTLEALAAVSSELALGIDRARAAASQREMEERYRNLFENAPLGIYRTTPTGRFILANPALLHMLGYKSLSEISGTTFEQESAKALYPRAFLREALETNGRLVGFESTWRRRDGTEVRIRENAIAVRDEQGYTVSYDGTLEDITAQERAERALRNSERRLRAFVEHMLNGVVVVNERGLIDGVNPAAEAIFGYSRAELLGQPFSRLVTEPKDLLTATSRISEWEGRRKGGETFPFEISLFEFDAAEGALIGGSIRDLTESRKVERLKREFVSTVSHELRTPLTSIKGSIGLLRSGVAGEIAGQGRELLVIAERNATRLMNLINDILDLDKLESGKLVMRFSPVPIALVVHQALDAVRGFAEQEGVGVDCESAATATVVADGERLEQVVINLLSNAVKFSPRGSSVSVSAERISDSVEVRVVDRGRGIPEALRDAVFERFRQVDASDSRQKGGTGLGLAICRAIIQRHNGQLGVDSVEGKGSTFWFRIPMRPDLRTLEGAH